MSEEASPAPNPSRCIYGFVLMISSVCCFILYFLWAVIPSSILVSLGLEYFSSKLFAVAIPYACCIGLVLFASVIYPTINKMLTEAPDSINVLIDSQSRDPPNDFPFNDKMTKGIPPVCDLDVEEISQLLYYKPHVFDSH